ncbi:MAG: 3-deoxy-D-manno-octulosonic acid transferase [Paludibacteraceae bacterium]|nr:3-deoxy-D-manno-octulosonic acid transferase [Paludibacteraceae bacterium]
MLIYIFLVWLAGLFGHKKARMLFVGQRKATDALRLKLPHKSSKQQRIWIHAASVGEFEQARPIIERLRTERPEVQIVLTFFSPSGYNLRKDYDKVDAVTYLPFATRRNARMFRDVVKPDIAIFVKYEFWPAYLRELNKRGVKTYSVSSIFRERQAFFRWWGKPYLNILKFFTAIYVQDEASARLLQAHNIDKVEVAGDTRFDRVHAIAQLSKDIPQIARFVESSERVIIAGSTWQPDEELLARYIGENPDVKLVLAPHEIHEPHLHQIFQLFEGRYVRFTEATINNLDAVRVLVVDTMGMLSSIYRYGTVAYIGGGFGVGIHNTIEAAVYGLPVLFGPNYRNFREACALIDAGGGKSVKNYREFKAAMDEALANHEELGKKASDYVASELGATDKIYKKLFG